jgi:hypothetical protein
VRVADLDHAALGRIVDLNLGPRDRRDVGLELALRSVRQTRRNLQQTRRELPKR